MNAAVTSALWSNKFKTGDSLYDFEHQMLFGLIDNCIQLSRNKGTKEQLIKLLRITESYLIYHFSSEEAAMGGADDHRYDVHRAQHRYMLEKIKSEIVNLESADPSISAQEIAFTLYDWYKEHLAQEDVKLVH